jgi:hypothetical protein
MAKKIVKFRLSVEDQFKIEMANFTADPIMKEFSDALHKIEEITEAGGIAIGTYGINAERDQYVAKHYPLIYARKIGVKSP